MDPSSSTTLMSSTAAVAAASTTPVAARNAIASLADDMLSVAVALLNLVTTLVTFSTITVPSTVYAILHYSLTLQLNFPSLALLFIAALIAAFVWLRYRHLNRYERLREVPLTKDEGFNLHPDVAAAGDDADRGNFHNYLDEFLQAIRIFGFLEKPVFHELARHLQTRRLVAGDSLSLDSDFSFYIVVDGHVQVFAPLPGNADGTSPTRPADSFDDEEHNGFQLLNEVESGGTLSSLFTILSLFTEDVKLGLGDEEESKFDFGAGAGRNTSRAAPGSPAGMRRGHQPASRGDEAASVFNNTPSSALRLDAAALRNVPNAATSGIAVERLGPPIFSQAGNAAAGGHSRRTSSSTATLQQAETETVMDGTEAAARGVHTSPLANGSLLNSPGLAPEFSMPPAQASAPFPVFSPRPKPQTAGSTAGSSVGVGSPQFRGRTTSSLTLDGRPSTPGSVLSGTNGQGRPSDQLHREGAGTVARATVDTTLAVIPAEAFKRLTKKFPNAAAHIVQVILTRLSRVTFHTAHKYLGLTKEVMRTEKAINESACFSLPAEFYEQGGMERLRQRFLPEPKAPRDESEDDYFRDYERSDRKQSENKVPPKTPGGPLHRPHTPWGHPDAPLRTPTARTAVGPGDLLSMTGTGDELRQSGSPVSATLATPRPSARSSRSDDQRQNGMNGQRAPVPPQSIVVDENATATSPTGPTKGEQPEVSEAEEPGWSSFGLAGFDLKDEVMRSIAKSIGLAQAPSSQPPSVQASPYLSAQDALLQRSVFNSAFSSLSMLEGMMGDDESSLTGTTSSIAGAHHAELENEVEIRFFPAGSMLVKAGESHAGLFYVIDGFLDVLVPPPENENDAVGDRSDIRPRNSESGDKPQTEEAKVKPSTGNNKSREDGGRPGPRPSSGHPDGGSTGSSRARPSALGPSSSTTRVSSVSKSRVGNALDGTLGDAPLFPRSKPNAVPPKPMPPPLPKLQRDANPAPKLHPKTGPRTGDGQQKAIFSIGRGGIAGYLSSLLGAASYVDVRAKTDTYVGFLPAHALERMMERKPIVLLTLCKRLLSLLSPLILHIDSALDWQQVNAGQVIYREGDPSDSFYIVINGRLRAITEKQGGSAGVEVLSEYGQGDSVGELDVITNSARRKTLHAIRDSELAKMPMTLFNAISVRHPAITIQISRIIARRVRQELHAKTRPGAAIAPIPGLPDLGRNNTNLKTVAILPVTRQVPISDFANRLRGAFEDTIGGPTAFLNQSSVMSVLGRHAFTRMGKLKLAGWLAEQEQKYRLVLYVVDTAVSSPWAQTSIRQADCILLVGFGDDPSTGEYERLLLGIKTTARKELVLLHPERSVPPGSTREWLKSRPWIHAHHHVELPGITRSHASPVVIDPKAVKALRNLKHKLETSIQRYKGTRVAALPGRPHHFSDFARLARRLCGKSIGIVLGGGGARGCAHIGLLRAMEERGIPIDMVGGTSIGSLVGGLYAKEAEVVSSLGRAKKFSGRMASLWRFASDLTYPVVSYTTGHEFNRGIFKALAETHIEDMWLPFFCNTTNITWSRMEVHTTGYAWRYIRGSMTLAGLIPPLVDEGNMLVDGGYVDNLPVSVMLSMGASSVFASDVGSIDDTSPRSYGDTLSGWWVLINRLNPWSDARNIPSIPDIQARLTYVSSVKTLEETKNVPGCFYMRMPVEAYGTLEFGKFTEISQIGYQAASKFLDEWTAQGVLPTGIEGGAEGDPAQRRSRGKAARRNSI